MEAHTSVKSLTARIREGMRNPIMKPGYREIKAPDDDPKRLIAFGADFPKLKGQELYYPENYGDAKLAGKPQRGLASLVSYMNAGRDCPIYNMALVHEVGWTYSTQLDVNVTANFQDEIDPFGKGKSVNGIQFVESTMPQTGETNAAFVACAVMLHMEPEPFYCSIPGNAWTHPTVPAAQPISPNDWTHLDLVNGAFGSAVAAGTQAYVKAFLDWGKWVGYHFWHMARGFRCVWKQGRHTRIFDDLARHTAFVPPNTQNGSASSSDVDVLDLVRRTNDYYDSVLGSALDFLKVNRIRQGFTSTTTGGVPTGMFRVSRDLQEAGVTYGGIEVHSLFKGNSEFRKLAVPYFIDPGVPIGLILEETDPVESNLMRRNLSATQSFDDGIPPIWTDDENILAVPDLGADELSLDPVPVATAQTSDAGQAYFKGGEGKLRLGVVGFEMTRDQWSALNTDAELRDAVTRECGICFCQ